MHDEHPHPLLAQVPLTLSPFLSLPTATPLPYTYKQLPSTLPPSILSQNSSANQNPNPNTPSNNTSTSTPQSTTPNPSPAYITSSTGQTTASPDTILASCRALQSHLTTMETRAKSTLDTWEAERRERELAEKRRVAPGWLDGDVRLLRPEGEGRDGKEKDMDVDVDVDMDMGSRVGAEGGVVASREGEELDRVFGGLDLASSR